MGRWPTGAQDRLQSAAIELFAEHGYDRTTVAEIAEHAGLTERTYYNHFATKAEVLFPGLAEFTADLVEAVRTAPQDQRPLDAVISAFTADAAWYDQRRDAGKRRRQILDAHAELMERERAKMANLGTAIAGALRDRGSSDTAATLTAAAAVTVYQLATANWLADSRRRALEHHLHAAVDELRSTASHW